MNVIFGAFLTIFFCWAQIAAAAEIYVEEGRHGAVMVSGAIETGDAHKLQALLEKYGNDDGGPVVVLNSRGGDYLEGLLMGITIFENASSTLVKKGGVCLSACAAAFLGGRYLGATGGWSPCRLLEPGAVLGFQPFYASAKEKNAFGLGRETGFTAANFFYAYLAALRVAPGRLLEILSARQPDVVFANTPFMLKYLDVDLKNFNGQMPELSSKILINLAKSIVESKDPEDWDYGEVQAVTLSAQEFYARILEYVSAMPQAPDYGPILPMLQKSLQSGENMAASFAMLQALGTLPLNGPERNVRVVEVSGLDNVHHYRSKTAYFFLHNEGSKDLAINYWLCAPADTANNPGCESGSLPRNGSIIYGLYDPDQTLWPMTN